MVISIHSLRAGFCCDSHDRLPFYVIGSMPMVHMVSCDLCEHPFMRSASSSWYIPKRKRSKIPLYAYAGLQYGIGICKAMLRKMEFSLAQSSKRCQPRHGQSGVCVGKKWKVPAYIAMSHPPMGYSMSTTHQGCSVTPQPFDSDSYLLMIDKCCSK